MINLCSLQIQTKGGPYHLTNPSKTFRGHSNKLPIGNFNQPHLHTFTINYAYNMRYFRALGLEPSTLRGSPLAPPNANRRQTIAAVQALPPLALGGANGDPLRAQIVLSWTTKLASLMLRSRA
jgi:hypothetical protein